MKVILSCLLFMTTVEGGYYKVRPPISPALPPPMVHYGPHPPSHYHIPSSHHSHHHPHHLSHHNHHFQYHSSRKPSLHSHGLPIRDYYHGPLYPPKPNYIPWKNANSFRAPVVKETFNPPPISYVPSFIKDDDKGPIHTIPAPNLGPADKPHLFNDFKNYQKEGAANAALLAVLKHGIQNVNIPHNHGYQVTEDSTAHQQISGVPAYFAPDPDPSLPTYKVPATTDPKSQPSNGQIPLDLYLQQNAEAAQHNADSSNTLTAQDLFNLLNYQPNNANLIPQTQLQQHVLQPNIQFYNQPALIPQKYEENLQFTPQFHTFNYDEQTQQGAHGSDSFPSASMNLQLLQPEARSGSHESEGSYDKGNNEALSSDRNDIFDQTQQKTDITVRTIDNKENQYLQKIDNNYYKNNLTGNKQTGLSSYYTSMPVVKNSHTLVASGSLNNVDDSTPEKVTKHRNDIQIENKDDHSRDEIMKPEENVQLHKSIQIYENPYVEQEAQTPKSAMIDYSEDYAQEESEIKKKTDEHSHSTYGIRVRQKRYSIDH